MKADSMLIGAIIAGGVAGVATALFTISRATVREPQIEAMAGLGYARRSWPTVHVLNRFPRAIFNQRGAHNYGGGYSQLRTV